MDVLRRFTHFFQTRIYPGVEILSTDRSEVTIDRRRGIVKKTVKQHASQTFHREVNWLKRLSDFSRTPDLLDVHPAGHTLVMQYCGERLTARNLPQDWEPQMMEILNGLQQRECCHNDIKPRELLVHRGQLMLVDFGWATASGESIPPHWPKSLGTPQFRAGVHQFDDEYSFRKSVDAIIHHNDFPPKP